MPRLLRASTASLPWSLKGAALCDGGPAPIVTAVALILFARAHNPVLEVEVLVGDTSQPLVLRDGSDPCEIIRSFCGPRDACVWQLVKHVQPLLQADWAAASARLAISDAASPAARAAIASRDAHSPFLRRYNREKAKLAPEERVAHYAAVARLLPGNAAAIDHLACALTATGQRASAARVLRRGVEVLHLWPSALQRPSTLVAGLEARPLWDDLDEFPAVRAVAGGAVLAALLPELVAELARDRADSLVVAQAEGLVDGARARWDEIVLFKHDVDDAAAAARFPRTLAAIRDADDGRGPSFFNAKVHGGGASIRVGDRAPVSWVPGEALVLDDSFEHEVVHAGAAPRVVLILDFWHPDLPAEDRAFAKYGVTSLATSTCASRPRTMSALSLEQEKNRMQESELIRLRTENSQLRQQLVGAAAAPGAPRRAAPAAGADGLRGGRAGRGRPQPMPPQQPMAAAPRMMAAPPPRPQFPPSPIPSAPPAAREAAGPLRRALRPGRRAARGRARAAAGGARRAAAAAAGGARAPPPPRPSSSAATPSASARRRRRRPRRRSRPRRPRGARLEPGPLRRGRPLGGAAPAAPRAAATPAAAPAASTFALFGGGDDDETSEEEDDDDDGDEENAPAAAAPGPAAPAADDEKKKKKASKEEKKAKKEAKKQEKKKKKEAKERQRRELQARADSRNPESFSSSYSRGGMGGSTNSKWQGIGSDSVSSAGYGPSGGSGGFSSSKFDNPGKYRGFGNPAFDNNVGGGDDDEARRARAPRPWASSPPPRTWSAASPAATRTCPRSAAPTRARASGPTRERGPLPPGFE
ncbi:peptide-aspartate beta-dioxygenase [Aureococcus anophagefferens]|nr:peptide-aspartate beta-dioxygenase [Aureococcus anophagefferens]